MRDELKKRIAQINAGTAPAGYKKTKVGIVPEDWTTTRLGKVFSERSEKHCEELELLSITGNSGVIPRSQLDKKDNSSEDKSNYLKICKGDIGYNTMRMWQGVSAYSHYTGIVSPAYTVLIPSQQIDAHYFAYLFKTARMVSFFYRFSQGLVDDTRNLKYPNFKKILASFPSDRKEQQKIAEILTAQDEVIALMQKQIELLQKQKKAFLQKMFPKKGSNVPEIRFAGFTDAWEQRKLGEISERVIVGLATSVTPYYRECGTPILRNLNIKENYLDDSDILYLDNEYANAQAGKKIHVGDVLTVHTGYIGTSCVVPEKYDGCLTFTTLITTTNTKKITGKFLSLFLNSEIGLSAVQFVTTQGGRQNLNTNDFIKVQIPFPAVDEQKKIVRFFDQLDHVITLHQRKLEIEQRKKKALMQLLLSGKVRVES